jgi:hypothetical protein
MEKYYDNFDDEPLNLNEYFENKLLKKINKHHLNFEFK